MRFSLILATLGRSSELQPLLQSLATQTCRDFDVVIVDQNHDDRLRAVLAPFRERLVIHLCRSAAGLSRARNVGLERASGEIVAFPDDDCWYPPDLLERVDRMFRDDETIRGLTGRAMFVPGSGRVKARFDQDAGPITRSNVWKRACSYTLFFRREVVRKIGGFDETLGLGSETAWGGGEDIDYPLRAIEAGFAVQYRPDLQVFHPDPPAADWPWLARRAYTYGAGIGRVWRKHGFPMRLVLPHLIRPAGGSLWCLATLRHARARYHWSAFRGRFHGFYSSADGPPKRNAPPTTIM